MAIHRLRIGEVARRSGVPVELLRAWERRYGVPAPERSASGFRLYSDDEVARVREMRALVDSGVSPAEAARSVATVTAEPPEPRRLEDTRTRVLDAIRAFDEGRVQATLDSLLATLTVETVLADVVLPAMRDVGDGWERGELTVAQEHFASQLFRGRL